VDGDFGFFTRSPSSRPRTRAPDLPPPDPSQRRGPGGVPSERRSPVLGLVASALVAFGIGWTFLAGNLGGLIGMPVMLTGTILGAVAWGRDRHDLWGMAAVIGTLAVIGLSVLSGLAR
jgi:hypothetical protein